jgi:antitoxin PrlF
VSTVKKRGARTQARGEEGRRAARRSTPRAGQTSSASASGTAGATGTEPALRSKLTIKSQTTLPSGVRKALGLRPGVDEIEYVIRGDEAVVRRAVAPASPEDPALLGLLDLLERDIAGHAERLQAIPRALYDRLKALTAGIRFDADAPIDGPVAL